MGKVALIVWSLLPRKFEQVTYLGAKQKIEITFLWLGKKFKTSINK
ncbi:hypothetical protein [Siminovitchia fordii]|nr:hypothetical protein [Siminovitchia fordii]